MYIVFIFIFILFSSFRKHIFLFFLQIQEALETQSLLKNMVGPAGENEVPPRDKSPSEVNTNHWMFHYMHRMSPRCEITPRVSCSNERTLYRSDHPYTNYICFYNINIFRPSIRYDKYTNSIFLCLIIVKWKLIVIVIINITCLTIMILTSHYNLVNMYIVISLVSEI